jgi:effector-binding domain-containing protein/DNA-binding transcriptional MerR regulator
VDRESGYRYYSQKQIFLLSVIRDLKSLDFSLHEIKEAVKRDDSEHLQELYRKKRGEVQKQMDQLAEIRERIDCRFEMFESMNEAEKGLGSKEPHFFHIKKLPARWVAYTRKVSGFDDQAIVLRVSELQKIIRHHARAPYLMVFHESYENPHQTDFEVATQVPQKENQNEKYFREIPGGYHAAAIYKGIHEHSIGLYRSMLRWLENSGYKPAGPVMKEYIRSLAFVPSKEEILSEIQIPIKKIRT